MWTAMQERRRHPRTPVSWPVRLWVDGDLIVGRALNASLYGICVAAAPTVGLKVGDSYRMSVLAGGHGELSCLGQVRRLGELGAGLETDQILPVR